MEQSKCQFCELPAERNYQKLWVSWVKANNEWGKEPRVEQKRNTIDIPHDPNNVLVCKKHEKEWLDSNIKI